jgi:hypothetical protein
VSVLTDADATGAALNPLKMSQKPSTPASQIISGMAAMYFHAESDR